MDKLKKQSIWVCVNFAEEANGHLSKKPFAASGGPTGADASHSDTWVTYDQVKKAADEYKCGTGFAVPEGYFFLDIDHQEKDDPVVQEILEKFDTYSEYSISSTGIHIYGKCDLEKIPSDLDSNGKRKLAKEFYTKNPNNGIELYIGGLTSRFAVYTGAPINDRPLTDCTQAILNILDTLMRRDHKKGNDTQQQSIKSLKSNEMIVAEQAQLMKTENTTVDVPSIAEALRKQKNGKKFSKLYDDGDFRDYRSQSEADQALCSIIAFRTGPYPDRIDQIFRTSRLYRDKWRDREDYRNSTIDKAIAACNGKYHKSVMKALTNDTSVPEEATTVFAFPYFVKINEDGRAYVDAPLLAKYIRETVQFILVRDSGSQSLLIYVYEEDEGYYRLYAPDMFRGLIKKVIAEYDEELIQMRVVNEVYQQLTTDLVYVPQEKLNANETVINFSNGLLHISATELTLTDHSKDILSTIQIPCNWMGSLQPTPVFDAYIYKLANGDQEIIQLLLEFIGACLSNVKGWRMKKALFLVGDGNTGKSQLKSLVEWLLGKGNFIGMDLKEIEARFGTGMLYGKRLAGSSDMSFMTVSELKTFKMLTGGDSLFAEFKGQQPFEFTYNGLLWFCMNRLPKFGGDDGRWVYDRIMVVDCPNVIPEEEQDKRLLDKMYAEREGIVYKAIKAFQTVIANGYRFTEPESVKNARESYLEENNSVISFFNECMCEISEVGFHNHCTAARIYKVYVAWCKDNNSGHQKPCREFRLDLRTHLGIEKYTQADKEAKKKDELIRKIDGTEFFRYYELTEEAKTQYSNVYGFDDDQE